jgi:translation initiation factor IF-3
MNKKNKKHLINHEINTNQVRVTEGGIMSLKDAIQMAESKEMDVVLMSANSNPPVVKIMNYEKFIYEQAKKDKQKPKALELKEIKVGPNTSENDLSYRIKHISEFLDKGHKVKITMQFKGREMSYVDAGQALILKMILAVEEHGVPESMPKLEGKKMFCTIRPKTK